MNKNDYPRTEFIRVYEDFSRRFRDEKLVVEALKAFSIYELAHSLANFPEQMGHELGLLLKSVRLRVDASVDAEVSLTDER